MADFKWHEPEWLGLPKTTDDYIKNYTISGDKLEIFFNSDSRGWRTILFDKEFAWVESAVTCIKVSREFAIKLMKKATLISHKGNYTTE